jgi:hypothetical protein
MKVWRPIERTAHWIGLFLGIVAIVAVVVIIDHPSEKSGNQPSFAGAEQGKKRLAIFLDGTWNTARQTLSNGRSVRTLIRSSCRLPSGPTIHA